LRVDAFDAVPDNDVRVELRVVGAARELRERRCNVSMGADRPRLHAKTLSPIFTKDRVAVVVEDRCAGCSPCRGRHRLHVCERLGGGLLERLNHMPARVVVAERPQQGHRLVRRERQIPRSHPVLTKPMAQLLPRFWMLAVKQPHEPFSAHHTVETHLDGAAAVPTTARCAALEVVVLTGRDLTDLLEVVILVGLRETQHPATPTMSTCTHRQLCCTCVW